VTTPAVLQQPTPERFFNATNAYEQTEAMKAAVELEIFTAIAEAILPPQRSRSVVRGRNAACARCAIS
jgi:hypothetical protein